MALKNLFNLKDAVETSDGEGVSIRRSLGIPPVTLHDPFLLLDEFYSTGPKAGPGFPDHPHRGFSTLTFMLKGHMTHADNMGNSGRVGPGGFQWMTAGKGIIHSERPDVEKDGMRGMQLWVNLPAKNKMQAPFYINGEAKDVPEVGFKGGSVRILAGEFKNKKGPINKDGVGLIYFYVTLDKDRKFKTTLPSDHNALFYILDGGLEYGGAEKPLMAPFSLGLLGPGEEVLFKGKEEGTSFVLISGAPIKEPIARYGPFVMNSKREIEQAISDFQNGLF